jgi:hypothetical protein
MRHIPNELGRSGQAWSRAALVVSLQCQFGLHVQGLLVVQTRSVPRALRAEVLIKTSSCSDSGLVCRLFLNFAELRSCIVLPVDFELWSFKLSRLIEFCHRLANRFLVAAVANSKQLSCLQSS